MANREHLRTLRNGVEYWNEWRYSKSEGVRPDLSGANLSGMYLAGAHLNDADLARATFKRATLTKADLRNCDLSFANAYFSNLENADLSNANLTGALFRDANLSGAMLNNAIITDANFDNANLTDAGLNKALLINTSLREASLIRCKFAGANLKKADLTGSDLTDANFSLTNLEHTDLTDATLSRVKCNEARVVGTIFGNNDVSQLIGLEQLTYLGPFTIGVNTLYRSGGNIPEIFLRGAGTPEIFITYLSSLTNQPIQFYSCFISYSHQDKGFARRLHDSLQGAGIRCWLDEHQLLPGDDIYAEVDRGIRLWDKVLLCCSSNSLTSWWVDNEINTAFEKEQQLMKKRRKKTLALIPLNLDDYLFSPQCKSAKASQIKARMAADFTGWETDNQKFENEFERVIKALQTQGSKQIPPQSKI